ncbi:thermonuclease family protein [Proteiniclasticum sp.]|uniref:thermonuclease family protein n=1 Tax=Proteiniclasticum sp. TaxID=2053595 RepID=UPI00289FE6AA|nr:thermonuclease family protein [Proteiniclasticum sp.]
MRIIGVNTPEATITTELYGKEASNYTKEKLTGKTIYLQKDVSDTDKYGRLLRYAWLEVPNEITKETIAKHMFNAHLLLEGYGQPYTLQPDSKHADIFVEFARGAREEEKGLWKINQEGTTKGTDF